MTKKNGNKLQKKLIPIMVAAIANLLLFACRVQADEKPDGHPNILILYADDLGYGDLGCYNPDSKIPTPNLDRLASEGMRFADGHSSSGICTPSRYALLTGRYHWRDFHGIVNAFGKSVFKKERLTLPELLKEKGYRTAAIGKWHLGWDWNAIRKPNPNPGQNEKHWRLSPEAFDWSKPIPDGPLAHGFDTYFGDTVINFPPYAWIEDDKLVKAPDVMKDEKKWKPIKEGHWECRQGPMCSDWDPYQNIPVTTQKGVDYIHQQAENEQPFFLYFAFPSPHAPIIPNDQFDGKSGAGPYGDFVVETDDACGRLLRALQESGQADNTIVIFSADNGPERYAYPRDEKFGHWSAEPLRGLKRDVYEGGHRVPFIVRWPGVTKASSTCKSLVSQVDIMATIADIVGYELPDKNAAEDSFSLLPVLEGRVPEAKAAQVRRNLVHNTFPHAWGLREGVWNLIAGKNGYHSKGYEKWEAQRDYPPDDDGPVELYHIVDDPGQRHNVASDHPKRVAAMRKTLKKIRQQGYSAPRLPPKEPPGRAEIQPERLIVYKSVGGAELKLHLFEPAGLKASDRRPAIVFFFGGGWAGGTPRQFYEQARLMADHGLVAVAAEYRVASRHKTTPFECVKDGKSAIRWLRQHAAELGVDPQRIVASGGSAGGHVAACTGVIEGFEEEGEATNVSSVPNAMILFNPVLDTTKKGFGANRFSTEQRTDLSPCHHVRPAISPTLLFHGTADTTVPFENAERFAGLMTKAGNACQLVPFEERRHGFFNGSFFRPASNGVDFHATMEHAVKFLAELGYIVPAK